MKAHIIGKQAERFACVYLKKQGLKFIKANYHSRFGEIDLIMRDKSTVVFIEVRARSDRTRTTGADSVSPQKQRKLTLAAYRFLQQHYPGNPPFCRFDVLDLQPKSGTFIAKWIKGAFEAYY